MRKEDAERMKTNAMEAIRAALNEDKLSLDMAIAAMEVQLEKILENIQDLIKEKEQELKSSESAAPEKIAYILLIEDDSAIKDLTTTANQTIYSDLKIPEENKEKAISYSLTAATDGFKRSRLTNAKLPKFSDNEEEWDFSPNLFRRFEGYEMADPECRGLRRFNFQQCTEYLGFRFCRRTFFRRFFQRRGYHHFFHERDNKESQNLMDSLL